MKRVVRCGMTQVAAPDCRGMGLEQIREEMIARHMPLLDAAEEQGVQVVCLQELCTAPYFCAEQEVRWYEMAERIPDGPTVQLMCEEARRRGMVMVVPIFEQQMVGVFFNTAAVIDADGRYLGKYRKAHIPHCHPGFWEKFYFQPGNIGYPVFETAHGRIGVYICYDRHFPEGARALGLAGAEIVFIPSATTAGHSEYLWKLEQTAHAVANGYFVGTSNRVGLEQPWEFGEFYGNSYFSDPRGNILAEGSRTGTELVVADLDLQMIATVRAQWQFFRDRREETYGDLVRDPGARARSGA